MKTASYGNATVDRIIDLDPFVLPLGFLFPDSNLDALRPFAEALAGHVDIDKGQVMLAVQSHVIRFGGKTILIDTCVGEDKERPNRPEWHRRTGKKYLSGLAACGCKPEDVDIVMCTHLHADHVGWNTKLENGRWVPTFPNAQYVIGKGELSHTHEEAIAKPTANHASFQDSVLPIIEHGLVKTVEAGDAIIDGTKILGLPGHTPGQIGLEIVAGNGENLVFCGDAIHSPMQIFQPEWSSKFCSDPQVAAATRLALMERAAAEDLRLIPAHLRTGSMKVEKKTGGFAPVFFD